MRSPIRLLPVLAITALMLAACGTTDGITVDTSDADSDVGSTIEPADDGDEGDDAGGVGESGGQESDEDAPASGGSASDEPVFDCREVDGAEVCDTFGESDEGLGTTG